MVDKETLGQVSFEVLQFSRVIIIPPMRYACKIFTHWCLKYNVINWQRVSRNKALETQDGRPLLFYPILFISPYKIASLIDVCACGSVVKEHCVLTCFFSTVLIQAYQESGSVRKLKVT
jgi:hypothetical protein